VIDRLVRIPGVTSRAVVRRLRHGPRHPTWSWRYELTIALLRAGFARTGIPFDRMRREFERLGDLEARRRRVAWERIDAADVRGLWAIPRERGDHVLLWLHGGAYVFGSAHAHRGLLAGLALRSRARTLGLDYRLAPEHPCPAAIEDGVAAVRWLYARGLRPERLVMGGDSAGGGLTLTTMLALREAGLPLPARAVLLSPWTDLEVTGPSVHEHWEHDYLGHPDTLHRFGGYYAGDLDRRDPRVSPLHADLAGLPPLLVVAGGAETILDDSTRLAERARASGVEVTLDVEPGEIHVFPAFADVSPRGKAALRRIAAFVRGDG
jgi:acetyl esterase/lipase